MLSTILQIGGVVALIGGVAYFFFMYAPYFISLFNSAQEIVINLSVYIPDWLQPFLAVSLLLSAVGLIIKVL